MKAVDKLLGVALAEVGYLEKKSLYLLDDKTANAGSGNFTKYARDLDKTDIFNGPKQGFEWCAVFAVWPFKKAFGAETARKMLCLPKKSCAAGVDYFQGYFETAGRFAKKGPLPGDIIFFLASDLKKWQHVGIVERVADGMVYTVEGNTSGASGVIWNGGGVAKKTYPLDYERIGGYGRPDWSLAPEEVDDVTRYNTMDEVKKGASFAVETVQKLIDRGIIVGGGVKDKDDNPADMDLSHDMLRLLCFMDRAGAFDRA